MTVITAILTMWIVLAVMSLLFIPRPTEEERRFDDEEFVAEMAKRRGDRT